MKKILAVLLLAVGLTGCSALGNVSGTIGTLNTVLSSDTGKAFIGALGFTGTLTKSIQDVAFTIDTGISSPTAVKALNSVCYALPWAEGAMHTFGPAIHLDPRIMADADAAVNAFLNGPCTSPPHNIGQVITQGTQLYVSIVQQLKSGGVPVATPSNASLAVRASSH